MPHWCLIELRLTLDFIVPLHIQEACLLFLVKPCKDCILAFAGKCLCTFEPDVQSTSVFALCHCYDSLGGIKIYNDSVTSQKVLLNYTLNTNIEPRKRMFAWQGFLQKKHTGPVPLNQQNTEFNVRRMHLEGQTLWKLLGILLFSCELRLRNRALRLWVAKGSVQDSMDATKASWQHLIRLSPFLWQHSCGSFKGIGNLVTLFMLETWITTWLKRAFYTNSVWYTWHFGYVRRDTGESGLLGGSVEWGWWLSL